MKFKFHIDENGNKQIIVDLFSENNIKSHKQPLFEYERSFSDMDLSMVGDFRYFGIERFNYKRRESI